MEPSNEEQPPILDRISRATRGKRMTKLLDDELEEDEAFWNQDALLEEENDGEYEAEPEIADEFDSDFGEDEPEPDDGVQNEAEAREKRPKKRLIYTGKPQTKKKKKKDLSKLEESLKDEMNKDVSEIVEVPDEEKRSGQPTTSDHHEEGDEAEGEKSVRKSTRTAVIVRQAEREAIRAALQATMKPVKRKKEGEEKRMSQEEMLLEAAQTEIMNLRHLERVLAREEEVKKRAIAHKAVYTGPQMRYSSKNGNTYIEFRNGLSFDSQISTKPVPYPQKALCVVTGLPAKYRDPKTGLPYATKEAFQIIRERYSAENNRAESKLASSDLYDSIIGQGFMGKRKRSSTPHLNEISYAQTSRRFCRIPSADDLDSD
ncbi:SWR1 complex subunit 2-like [Chenopodium quinoa]|uniref:SWR1 complex subunit 2-like n=1 Tax=Chenopodium quinoa TaxID=63459 RepID=UPI000B786A60|nr:SWR1 complex subunit 2-like [Chenopodium quinoa]XP_021756842.1 SWR1 complex subunit 2-like [Chenopodium quinoa]